METRHFLAIDLKSFYASVECVERGLNPLTTNLVVADETRTSKTICLAVTPSLKSYNISGRARLFEVEQGVKEANSIRLSQIPDKKFSGKSYDKTELDSNPSLEIDYIVAQPRMQLYMEYSEKINDIYLQYVASTDMHSYSVDEVFLDVTSYLRTYKITAREMSEKIVRNVLDTYSITATVGIGTNMYLAKIAMDIVAKHMSPNEHGARMAELDEMNYRRLLWTHEPLTDFWRVGSGIAEQLFEIGITNMGDIARCSLGDRNSFYSEHLLYDMFGVNAQLLIDHAWGYEPTEIADIKAYIPQDNSISNGQVLTRPYTCKKAKLVVREMADLLVLDLVKNNLAASQIVLTVGYDIENLTDPSIRKKFHGEIETDRYGRKVPKSAHGSINLGGFTSSTNTILDAVSELYDNIINPNLLVRRMYVVANHVKIKSELMETIEQPDSAFEQLSLFEKKEKNKRIDPEKEQKIQEAVLSVQERFGKNAMLKGMNFEDGGTTIERNSQIGGHKA